MHEIRTLQDQEGRQKINRDLGTNFLVEAGAGSGKTTSLVKRMVALVKTGKFQPGEIAAITFTRKAAQELKERFQTQLEEESKKAVHPEEKTNIKQAVIELDRTFIGTVHSFCTRLLRERPVEAGIDPDFVEYDELEEELLRQEAWESYLLEVRSKNPDILVELDRLGISPVNLKKGFEIINLYPEVEVVAERVQMPDLQVPLGAVLAFVKEAISYIPLDEPKNGYDKLQQKIRSAYRLSKYLDLNWDKNIIRVISLFKTVYKPTLYKWNSEDKAREYWDNQTQRLSALVNQALKEWWEYCYYYTIQFLLPAVEHYRKRRKGNSILIFQDLLLTTSRMLRESPEVRRYFQQKYRSILIDEFQDTDPIQAEIVFYLTGTDPEERDWTALRPREGSLFVVGDPKQSIYRFRRADIDTYNLVKGLIIKSGGEVLKLITNFRSVDSLADHLNPLFKKYFPNKADHYQAGYEPLETVQFDEQDALSGVWKISIPAEFTSKEDVVRADAEKIARVIKKAAGRGLKPGDFMILLPYRDGMDIYARTLEKYGIPSIMSGGSTLNTALEIRDLHKLLKLLGDINNQPLFAAVLKGSFFGISDQELYQYKSRGGYFNIYSEIPDSLDQQTGSLFKNIFAKIKKFMTWTENDPPSVTLEKIIDDLGLLPVTARQELGMSRCGNIYYLQERVRKAEVGGRLSFQGMLKELEVILNSELKQELNLTRKEDVVRIMNLHKAKGLQSPVVFLAHPKKHIKRPPDYHISRGPEKTRGYFVIKYKVYENFFQRLAQPGDWDRYLEEEKRYQEAEELRNLYVAATRARRLLIISSSDKSNRKNFWTRLLDNSLKELKIDLKGISAEAEDTLPEVKGGGTGDLSLTEKDFQAKRRELKNWKETYCLANPGYLTTSPSRLKADNLSARSARKTGGGAAWGTAVHQVMEKLINDLSEEDPAGSSVKTSRDSYLSSGDTAPTSGDPVSTGGCPIPACENAVPANEICEEKMDIFIEKTLLDNGLSTERKIEVQQLIKRFKDTALWERIKRSEEIFTEVPLTTKVEPGDDLYACLHENLNETTASKISGAKDDKSIMLARVPVILSGVIDLVFKDDKGWVIVDYKTDRVESESDLAALRVVYLKQVEVYGKVWEEINDGPVSEMKVLFI